MKTKNIFRWLCTIIQISLISFSLTIYYLSDKKMGLMRSLTYKNDVYNKLSLNLGITYGLSFILVLFIITMIRVYKDPIKFKYSLGFVVLNLLSIILVVNLNTYIVISYYIFSLSITGLLIIQLIKFNFF